MHKSADYELQHFPSTRLLKLPFLYSTKQSINTILMVQDREKHTYVSTSLLYMLSASLYMLLSHDWSEHRWDAAIAIIMYACLQFLKPFISTVGLLLTNCGLLSVQDWPLRARHTSLILIRWRPLKAPGPWYQERFENAQHQYKIGMQALEAVEIEVRRVPYTSIIEGYR